MGTHFSLSRMMGTLLSLSRTMGTRMMGTLHSLPRAQLLWSWAASEAEPEPRPRAQLSGVGLVLMRSQENGKYNVILHTTKRVQSGGIWLRDSICSGGLNTDRFYHIGARRLKGRVERKERKWSSGNVSRHSFSSEYYLALSIAITYCCFFPIQYCRPMSTSSSEEDESDAITKYDIVHSIVCIDASHINADQSRRVAAVHRNLQNGQ